MSESQLVLTKAHLLDILKEMADRLYCDMITLARKPEACGWEAKVKSGKFGNQEFDAHCKISELYGKYLGLLEARKEIRKHLA